MGTGTELIYRHLFIDETTNVYAVLDGASAKGLVDEIFRLQPPHECLFRGDLAPDMQEVAPYLIKLEPDSEFADWVLGEGWGKHWGIFATSESDLAELKRHLRKFLVVHSAQGKPMSFRFYDPRVLRIFLPTCTTNELELLFGPIATFITEDKDAEFAVRFKIEGKELKQDRINLNEDDE